MIGRDRAAAEALTAGFRAVAKLNDLPPKWRRLFEDVLASAVDPRVPGAILPAPVGEGCRVYAVAADQMEWRRLRPLLSAFAGPTLTSFTGVIQPPKGTDPIDAFARTLPSQVVAVAEARDTSVDAMRALRRMIAAIGHAPESAADAPRSTSWLLSDFEDALNVRDRGLAERLIARFRDECRLDVLNLRFLDVQMLATLGSWAELRALPWFEDLCLARKPATIAAHLAETLFRSDLADSFGSADVAECNRAWAAIRHIAAPLVLSPPPAALGTGGWRLYAFAALAAEQPEPYLLNALKDQPGLGWIATKLAPAPSTEPAPAPSAPEPEDDLAQIQHALERLAELAPAERTRLIAIEPFRSLLRGGAELTPSRVPLCWRDWLSRIADPDYTQAFEIARRGKDEWPVEVDPVAAVALADALADALDDDVSRARLAQALPLIVAWLQRDQEFPRASLRPLYQTLLTLFALGEARDRGIMESTVVIGEALFGIGVTASDYQALIQSLSSLITEGMGMGSVNLLLELIEATLRHPCPNPSAREEFWLTALALLEPLRSRLNQVQRASLLALGEMLGWGGPLFPETTAPKGTDSRINGHRIGIYTLTESAARQAVSVLAQIAPNAIVHTSSEHVGSPQLKAVAESTDLLVITSLSATHAATDFLRAHRPAGKPIRWAAGRGFTSIVRAIEEHFSSRNGSEAQSN